MTEQMNPEIKRRWLAALRSGKYEQGQCFLRLRDKFCCLGVLCDLAKEDGIGNWSEPDDWGVSLFMCVDDKRPGSLPVGVVKWAELQDENPYIKNHNCLATLNDCGNSFSKIADLIEKYL